MTEKQYVLGCAFTGIATGILLHIFFGVEVDKFIDWLFHGFL